MRRPVAATSIVCALLVARHSFGQEAASAPGAAAAPTAATTVVPRIRIGIISSRNTAAGQGHEDSIRVAEHRLGNTLTLTDTQVRLELLYETDDGNPDQAAQKVHDLVENHGVAAIIGPVESDCTKRVIQEGLNVPIISALSTNPGLTDDRDRWFFRATLNDRDRMVRYAQFVTATLKISIGPHVLLCDSGSYGTGLCAALSERLGGSANLKELTWDKIGDGVSDPASPERLRSGTGFSPRLGDMIAGASSIFILGPSKQAVAIALGIKEAYRPPERVPFFFVGSDTDLLLDAPEGSYTIGEPVSDLDESPLTQPARNELAKIQEEFASRSPHAENFVLTAYEAAYYVLPAAIASAVGSQGKVPELAALRDAIRDKLESDTFDSLTPGRTIRFQEGSLAEPPPAPIYHIRRRFVREDPLPARAWLDLRAPHQGRYLEGPTVVGVRGKGVSESTPVELTVLRDEDNTIVTRERLDVSKGEVDFRFHPLRPGWYRVTTSIPTVPSSVQVQLVWSGDYLLCLLGGFVGSWMAVLIAASTGASAARRIATGVGTGLALTVLSYYRTYLPPSVTIPFPTLGTVPELNAVFTGFLGGWLGLNILHLMRGEGGRSGTSFDQKT